jgi:hypothetical protein
MGWTREGRIIERSIMNDLQIILTTFFLTLYASRLWWIMPMYQDDYVIREYNVLEDNQCWFAWHMRAFHRWEVGSFHEAMTMWVMCRMISPKEFKILINLATVLRMLNKIQESKYFIEEAERNIIPGQEEAAKRIIQDVRDRKNVILK